MFPSFTLADISYGIPCYTKEFCNVFVPSFIRNMHISNFFYYFIRKANFCYLFSSCHLPFFGRIFHIFFMCSKFEMGRINASRSIATRTVVENFYMFWNYSVMKLPRKAICFMWTFPISSIQLSITTTFRSCPQPTSRSLFNILPETFMNGFCSVFVITFSTIFRRWNCIRNWSETSEAFI